MVYYYMGQRKDDIGTREDLCRHRLDVAEEDLNSAKVLLNTKDYRGANNRAYYCILHAINAVHALAGVAYKRHKDAIANFNKTYVKEEVFDKSIGRKVSNAEKIRNASDYDDFYIANIKEAEEQVKVAEEILQSIRTYCMNRING